MNKQTYRNKTAFVVGAGGLGCPVTLGLAEAGIGRLVLVDPDIIEVSNLHRQVLYSTYDVGRAKVVVAKEVLTKRFTDLEMEVVKTRVDADNIDGLLLEWRPDILIDASDDPAARFVINDRALAHGLPAVIGGVIRFEGMVMGVAPHAGACFRCLFEAPPEAHEVATCAQAGVLGAMAGIIGHLQVERALGLLSENAAAHAGYVTTVDGIAGHIRRVPLSQDKYCAACGNAHSVDAHHLSQTRSQDTSQRHAIGESGLRNVTIRIPTPLRKFAAGRHSVAVDSLTVRQALEALDSEYPGIRAKICDDSGNIRRFINVYANQEDIRFLDNLDTQLTADAELEIVPAIAGA